MIALIIVVLGIIYAGTAFQTARHLVGQSKYTTWLNERVRYPSMASREFSDFVWGAEEGFAFFGWFSLALGCLPVALALTWARSNNDGSLAIAPKAVRDEVSHKEQAKAAEDNRRQIAQQSAYIAQLERDLLNDKEPQHA